MAQRVQDLERRFDATQQAASAGSEALASATTAFEDAQRLVAAVQWTVSTWLTVVSVIVAGFAFVFGALVFSGWREYGLVKSAKDDATRAAQSAQDSARRIGEAEHEVALSRQRLQAIDQSIAQAIHDVAAYFGSLPPLELERLGIVGEPPEYPLAEQIAPFEEADVLIVVAEKSRAVEPASLVDPFIRPAQYWRLIENFPKAIARFTKALELDPGAVEAHRGLARSYYALAVQPGMSQANKNRLLEQAEAECRRVTDMVGPDIRVLFDLGWIYDERGQYERAVEFYREAQRLDTEGRRPNVTYNLACSYAKWGKFQEALDELRKVIDVDDNWDDAQRDSDFAALREDPVLGPLFWALIEQGRKRP